MRFILGLGFGALTTLSSALLLDWHASERVFEPVVDPQPISQHSEPETVAAADQRNTALAVEREAPAAVSTQAADEGTEALTASTTAMPASSTDPAEEAANPPVAIQPTAPAAARDEVLPDTALEAGGRYAVWRPFHSQLSAKGFARRLSLQLGYPFDVVKVDAAEYLVVFAYDDEAQRELLSAQVTELTGYTPR